MKPYKFYKRQTNSIFLIGLFLTIAFLISCKKNEINNVSNLGEVSINVSSIKEQMVIISDIGNTQNQKASNQKVNTLLSSLPNNEQDFDGFSWSLSPDSTSNSKILSNASSVKRAALLASPVTTMDIGKKYRILFYEVKNGTEVFRESAEITVASTRYTLNLMSGSTYRWYAYSYNDAGTIPVPADVNNPVIETRIDAPFLYDEGEITTNVLTDNNVDIQFEHKVSKIELKVDALQMFANSFTSLKANYINLPLTTQGFGLKTGTLNTPVLSTVNYNSAILFTDEASPSIKISTNKLYTSTPLTDFQVLFTEVILNKSGTIVNLINPSNPRTAAIGGFSTSSESLKRGLVTLKYKGGVIGNTEWAQGILYYDPTDPSNPYKISEPFLQGKTHDCNYYWNWNSLYPRSMTNDKTTTFGDACMEVFPKNTWRTPTRQDFSALNTAIANNPVNGAVYFNADNGERVYFHEAGWIINNKCTVGNTSDGFYWSSEEKHTHYGYVLQVDGAGITAGNSITDRHKKYGMSIKCIKNL